MLGRKSSRQSHYAFTMPASQRPPIVKESNLIHDTVRCVPGDQEPQVFGTSIDFRSIEFHSDDCIKQRSSDDVPNQLLDRHPQRRHKR